MTLHLQALSTVLHTPRLVLRPPNESDLQGIIAFASEPETMRFLGGVQSPDTAWRGLAMLTGSWTLVGFGMFSVIERETGRWVGRIGPWHPGGPTGGWPGTEVGWGLLQDAQGKGYAQEAATAAMDWAFDQLGWNEVIHCIEPSNAPSIALAERLGSQRLRNARLPAPIDVEVGIWGQSRQQWLSRR